MRRWPLLVVAVVIAALVAAEGLMQPTARDRLVLFAVFGTVALLVSGGAEVLGRLTSRMASLHTAVLVTAVGAVAAAAAAILGSAASMFISGHDLRLVLVALGLGVALGVVLAAAVTRPLQEDLASIRSTAARVAAGERDARTGVTRADEVGDLARALDDMIERLEASEVERERMEKARREFFASIGHDLRTPLTSLRGAIEAVEDGMVEDPARYLRSMRSDVALLSSLVDDVFLFSRIESGALHLEQEACDLTELADEAVEVMSLVGRDRDVAVVLIAETSVPVTVSAHEVGRVLRNLLDNAIRHSPSGGTVRVEVSEVAGQARLAVRDDGPGFDAAFVDRAFESFVRADDARRRDGAGAGLGLAIARGLVQAHGGTIGAHPGPGGRVEVSLPRRGGQAQPAVRQSSTRDSNEVPKTSSDARSR